LTVPATPDSTAERVALWRAMHVQVDAPPHVLEDVVGLALVAPSEDWRSRPDMDPQGTRGFRAAIVARARFIEDVVTSQAANGVSQYVLLGAGLDTFAQRRADVAGRMRVFEIDQPAAQAWKRQRLTDLGYGIPGWLRFVAVDFEQDNDWYARLAEAGFDAAEPVVVSSTGVSMYLTKDATRQVLDRTAHFTGGSTLVMTFMLPPELLDAADRPGLEAARKGARTSGTPFISFYAPDEMLGMASDAGFNTVRHVSGTSLGERYFAGRSDGLRPSSGEDFLIAAT
jgi:methyltransferase (TIGR00027 family)